MTANTKINRSLEIIRWAGVALGIFFAFYWGNSPQSQFSIFAIFSVIFLAGITAIESMFFGEGGAEVSGYGEDGAGYRRQSRMHFLALTVVMFFAWILELGVHGICGNLHGFTRILNIQFNKSLIHWTEGKICHEYTFKTYFNHFSWIITLYFLLPAL